MDEKILTLVKNCDLSKPMFRARSSEVFDLGDEKVLKLYFDSVSKENVDIELLNTTVAFETGCTPMECFGKVEVNGRQGLVFKKLYGESLTNMPMKNPAILFTAGKIIAALHTYPDTRRATALNYTDKRIKADSLPPHTTSDSEIRRETKRWPIYTDRKE